MFQNQIRKNWFCYDGGFYGFSKQLLDQEDVDVVQPLDREKGITVEDNKLIKMQMSNCMLSLSLSLSLSVSVCVFRFLILLGFNLIAKILFKQKKKSSWASVVHCFRNEQGSGV